MKKLLDILNKYKLSLIFIIYSIVVLTLIINHEIWVDEAQAWEIARTLSIPDIFAQMKYEGHPCLWHLILAIPAKLGLPVISMNIISWLFTSIAVYIILFKSKLNSLVKIAIIFSPTFIYYLPVISRNYCLTACFLSLFSIYYHKRHEHPIIYTNILGILAHTHLVICGFVGIAATLFIFENIQKIKEKKKTILAIVLILIIYFILLAIQIFPSFENCSLIYNNISIDKFNSIIRHFSYFFFHYSIVNKFPYIIILVFIISFILLFLYNKKFSIIYIISIFIFTLIHFFWPHTLGERTSIIFVILIFLSLNNKNIVNQIFIFCLSIFMLFSTKDNILLDLNGAFSASKEMGNWINENVEDDSLIIFLNSERHVSIAAYITKDVDYYNMKLDSYQTYTEWIEVPILNFNYTYDKIYELSQKYENIYIIHALQYAIYAEDTIEIIDILLDAGVISSKYRSYSNIIMQEEFSIYQLN